MPDRSTIGRRNREKGKVGEREFAKWLEGWHGGDAWVQARRSRQASGAHDQDLVHTVEGVHFEVTRQSSVGVTTAQLQTKLDQSIRDAKPGDVAVVAWRYPRGPWLVTISLEVGPEGLRWDQPVPATMLASDFMLSMGYSRPASDFELPD